jgi:hypothetical protein
MGFVALAAATVGSAIYQGQTGKASARKNLRNQEAAQKKAQSAAISARKTGEMEKRRVGRKPDIAALLGREGARSGRGAGATMLTGAGGVSPGSMMLGRKSSLGGGGGGGGGGGY